jgi:hypothetical protein
MHKITSRNEPFPACQWRADSTSPSALSGPVLLLSGQPRPSKAAKAVLRCVSLVSLASLPFALFTHSSTCIAVRPCCYILLLRMVTKCPACLCRCQCVPCVPYVQAASRVLGEIEVRIGIASTTTADHGSRKDEMKVLLSVSRGSMSLAHTSHSTFKNCEAEH